MVPPFNMQGTHLARAATAQQPYLAPIQHELVLPAIGVPQGTDQEPDLQPCMSVRFVMC